MALEIVNDTNKLKGNMNAYGIIFLVVLALIALYVISGNKIYQNLAEKMKVNKELETDVSLLSKKVDSLKNIEKVDSKSINNLSIAFPEEDSSLFMYSTLKELSTKDNIMIKDVVFSSSSSKDEISQANLGFVVTGTKESVVNFLNDLTKSAPLSGLGTISFSKYSNAGQELEISMTVDLYYSAYPKTLPNVDSIVSPLNEDEKNVYDNLTNLNILVNNNLTPMKANSEVVDPFMGQSVFLENSGM